MTGRRSGSSRSGTASGPASASCPRAGWRSRRPPSPWRAARSKGYAAGWWVNRQADGSLVNADLPEDAYWASGHDGQRLYVVPSARLVVVRLGFSPEVDPADLRTDELVTELVALGREG